jgi:hypothetical protein
LGSGQDAAVPAGPARLSWRTEPAPREQARVGFLDAADRLA